MELSVRAWLLALVLSFGSATIEDLEANVNTEVPTRPSVDPDGYLDEDLCDDVDCLPGQHCEMTIETGPLCVSCVAHPRCSSDPSLVCGSDSKTYMNACHLRRTSCETGKGLTVVKKGACGALPFDPCLSISCGPGYVCEMVRDDLSEATLHARCVCTDHSRGCLEEDPKSCGDHTCLPFQDCVVNNRNLHVCCIMDCSSPAALAQYHKPAPLCGSDGVLYSSLCVMDKIRCLTSKIVGVLPFMHRCISQETAHKCGSDKICSAIEVCARHEAGFSCCPASCPLEKDSVCASDGHLYDNYCKMVQHACMNGLQLEKVDMAHCNKPCKLKHGIDEAESGAVFTLRKDHCTQCTCNNGEWLCDQQPCMDNLLQGKV